MERAYWVVDAAEFGAAIGSLADGEIWSADGAGNRGLAELERVSAQRLVELGIADDSEMSDVFIYRDARGRRLYGGAFDFEIPGCCGGIGLGLAGRMLSTTT